MNPWGLGWVVMDVKGGAENRLKGETGSQQTISEIVAITTVRNQSLRSDSQTGQHFRVTGELLKHTSALALPQTY